jgi:hypothetical protein
MSVIESHQYFKILTFVLPPQLGQVPPCSVAEETLRLASLLRALSSLNGGAATGRSWVTEIVVAAGVAFPGDTSDHGLTRRIQHQSFTDYSSWIKWRPFDP